MRINTITIIFFETKDYGRHKQHHPPHTERDFVTSINYPHGVQKRGSSRVRNLGSTSEKKFPSQLKRGNREETHRYNRKIHKYSNGMTLKDEMRHEHNKLTRRKSSKHVGKKRCRIILMKCISHTFISVR